MYFVRKENHSNTKPRHLYLWKKNIRHNFNTTKHSWYTQSYIRITHGKKYTLNDKVISTISTWYSKIFMFHLEVLCRYVCLKVPTLQSYCAENFVLKLSPARSRFAISSYWLVTICYNTFYAELKTGTRKVTSYTKPWNTCRRDTIATFVAS